MNEIVQHSLHEDVETRVNGGRRVLIVSYAFPPVGGAGVQRVAKLVKYLGGYGWQSSVLTVENPSVPVLDQSLLRDVPAETAVFRAKSWEPGYRLKAEAGESAGRHTSTKGWLRRTTMSFARRIATGLLHPDAQILWYPNACRQGKNVLRTVRHDAVLATAPPFSTFLVGAALARHSGLPLVIDYRDEWTLSNKYWENRRLGPIANSIQSRMERFVLRTATGVLATTETSAKSLRNQIQRAESKANVSWIYNGYDADDFSGRSPVNQSDGIFRLVYVGTLWNLTSVAPLAQAIARFAAQQPDLARRLEVVFVGRRAGTQHEQVESMRSLPCKIVTHDYLDHAVALDKLCSADACCLLLSDVAGAERVVPAKLFEYMASRRPILALAPQGETWNLLRQYGAASCFAPNDTESIAQWLANASQGGLEKSPCISECDAFVSQFDRQYQAGQFAKFLENCCRDHVMAN